MCSLRGFLVDQRQIEVIVEELSVFIGFSWRLTPVWLHHFALMVSHTVVVRCPDLRPQAKGAHVSRAHW